MFSLGEKSWGDPTAAHSYLMGSHRDDGASLLALADGNNKGQHLKLHLGTFRLDVRKKFFPWRVMQP